MQSPAFRADRRVTHDWSLDIGRASGSTRRRPDRVAAYRSRDEGGYRACRSPLEREPERTGRVVSLASDIVRLRALD